MNLDKMHEVVKKLDMLLSDRHTGTTSWWVMLGNLLGQLVRISEETLSQD